MSKCAHFTPKCQPSDECTLCIHHDVRTGADCKSLVDNCKDTMWDNFLFTVGLKEILWTCERYPEGVPTKIHYCLDCPHAEGFCARNRGLHDG